MSVNAAIAPSDQPAVADKFIKDDGGRTVFYPYGPRATGYVVPDAGRERALRDAVARDRALKMRLLPFAVPLLIGGFVGPYVLVASRPFLAFAAFLLSLALLAVFENRSLRYQLGTLLAGLEVVDRSGAELGDRRRTSLALFAALAVLSWFTLEIYHWRLGLLPVGDGTTTYYADISAPLLGALICGIVLLVLIAAQDQISARIDRGRLLLTFLLFALFEAGCLGTVAQRFADPAVRVVVTRDELYCPWRVQWRDVADLSLTTGEYGKKLVELDMGPQLPLPKQPTPFWQPKHIFKQCEITSLNVDYSAVYRSMLVAWRQAHGLPDDASSAD